MMGHVFLVDGRGRVRWRAHGLPAPGEVDHLLKAIKQLMQRGEAA